MAPRRFTLEEAERLLPRLSELIPEMQERKRQYERLHDRAAALQLKMSSNGHIIEEELDRAQQELAQTAAEINHLIEKVAELGCELKDMDQGLVDFHTLREGREVYLCWKLGEPNIAWWHELDSGFAGRKPLSGGSWSTR